MATPAASDRSVARAEMAGLRQDEQRAAAAEVGVDDVTFLGYPDGQVTATWRCGETSAG